MNTPINLFGAISHEKVMRGDTISLTAATTKYADTVSAKLFVGTPYETSNYSLNGILNGSKKNWLRNVRLNQNIPKGMYTLEYVATTPNGNTEDYTVKYYYDPNREPTVTIDSVLPGILFKGNDMTIKCTPPRDLDGDKLDIRFLYSFDQENWFVLESKVGVTQGLQQTFTVPNVEAKTYYLKAEVFDPSGATGSDEDEKKQCHQISRRQCGSRQ